MAALLVAGAAQAAGPSLLDRRNLNVMGCAAPNIHYAFVTSSEPGNVFFPGDAVNLQIRLSAAGKGKFLEFSIGRIGMYKNRYWHPGWASMVPSGVPKIEFLGWRAHVRVVTGAAGKLGAALAASGRGYPAASATYLKPAPGGGSMLEVSHLPVPERYGCYVITVAPDGKNPQFLCTVLRAHRITPGFNTGAPILNEAALMTQGADNNPALLLRGARTASRLGLKILRFEAHWSSVEQKRGVYNWSSLDPMMHAMAKAGVRTMWTVDCAPFWTMPFDQPTPACIPTKADWSCEPKYLPLFKKWLNAACRRYWDHGRGSLWVLENWNEPWNGISISGWESDIPHYRAIMRVIAAVAHAQKPPMKTAAAGWIGNTENMFLTGRHPAKQIKMVDIFTDHYVQPDFSYGPMVAHYWQKQSMDTESWVACNEMMLPQVMTQFMACGQGHVNPCYPDFIYFSAPGSPTTYTMPTPVALACNTFSYFITDKPFRRMLFMHHLPFAFEFGTDPHAVVVLLGRLFTPFGNSLRSVLWWQFNLTHGGTMSFNNADGAIHIYNLDGNRVFMRKRRVTLPVTTLAYYLTCPQGGVELIRQRLAAARYKDVRPVEIIAHDFTQFLNRPGAQLHTTLHNLLPRKISGTLSIVAPAGIKLAQDRVRVALNPGQSLDVAVAVIQARIARTNVYPFRYAFASAAGHAGWSENLHALVAVHKTIKINGDLSQWKSIPGVMHGCEKGQAWFANHRWLPFSQEAAKYPHQFFSQVKLAYDSRYFYVLARVNDAVAYPGHLRLATRNDAQYFRSAKDDVYCESLKPYEKFILAAPWNTPLVVPAALQRNALFAAYEKFLATHRRAKAEVATGAAAVFFRERKINPRATFADATYVYKKTPHVDLPWVGNTLQFALHVIPGYNSRDMRLDTKLVPAGFHAMPDTDYEYALYACKGGGSELWRLLAPGVPRGFYWPRQPRAKVDQGPVVGSLHLVRHDGNITIYEAAIPWTELSQWHPQAGRTFGFTFIVNSYQGPDAGFDNLADAIAFGDNKSATKLNGLTLHRYNEAKPSCAVLWGLVK